MTAVLQRRCRAPLCYAPTGVIPSFHALLSRYAKAAPKATARGYGLGNDDDLQGFADQKILNARFEAKTGSFLLGHIHPDHGINFPAGINDDRHLFVMAGSRAGKGTSMLIPNLLEWQGGVFCIDPKGENAAITAMRRGTAQGAKGTGTTVRHFLNQNVAILDPMGTVKGAAKRYRVNYDPLIDVTVGSDEESSQIRAITESVVIEEGGDGSHFTESAATILAGLIEAVLHNPDETDRSMMTVRKRFQEGMKGWREYLADINTPAGLAIDALAIIEDAGDDEGGSFSTTLSRQLRWLADPRMQRHVQRSDFSLVKALRENWSVYVCLPPSQIDRMKRWLRAMVRIAFDAKMNTLTPPQGERTLFILDEFSSLGHMKLIEDAAAYMAGYGIKLVPVIQNIGQIQKLYEKNWETFLGNAGAIIAWGLNDLESEKYISDRMGNVLTWEVSESLGSSRKPMQFEVESISKNKSAALHERPVRRPNEVHDEGSRETLRAFIIPASTKPFMALRSDYMKRNNTGLFDSPDDIEKWERQHGANT